MTSETNYHAAIFDLDGTLIDSWPSLVATLQECLPSCHALDFSLLRLELSTGINPMFRLAAAQVGIETRQQEHVCAQLLARYLDEFVLDAPLYPGVSELLTQLQATGVRVGICTNRDRISSLRLLDHHNLGSTVEAITCLGDTEYQKPHPQPLHACLARLSALPGQTLFVGDSRIDAQCADAAGVAFAAHLNGYHRHQDDLAPAAFRFNFFTQLTSLLSH